eukprot:362807-Rhodomonas_salina.2
MRGIPGRERGGAIPPAQLVWERRCLLARLAIEMACFQHPVLQCWLLHPGRQHNHSQVCKSHRGCGEQRRGVALHDVWQTADTVTGAGKTTSRDKPLCNRQGVLRSRRKLCFSITAGGIKDRDRRRDLP